MDWEPEPSSNDSRSRGPAPGTGDRSHPANGRSRLIVAVAFAAVATLAASGCGRSPGGGPLGPAGLDRATVVQVVDGDTVELDIGGRRERVRLLGVDAPESVHPTLPVQCFGPEASAELGRLLPAGSTVRIERDAEPRDRYERLLLYLYRADDDLFVNRWLLTNGLADTAFYDPNTARAPELTRARSRARAGSVGLWGSCDGPDQPLDPPP